MRLWASLVLICVMQSAVYGLRCYNCWGKNPGECNEIWECPRHFDRCATTIAAQNLISKHCMRSDMCNNVYNLGMICCDKDLCNGAKHNGVFIPLLLLPLAIITLFI